MEGVDPNVKQAERHHFSEIDRQIPGRILMERV